MFSRGSLVSILGLKFMKKSIPRPQKQKKIDLNFDLVVNTLTYGILSKIFGNFDPNTPLRPCRRPAADPPYNLRRIDRTLPIA